MLLMTGVLLRCRYPQTSQKPFWFIILCALMVTMVGLRWTVDIALFRFLQPILGASVPVAAWLCFAGAHRSQSSTHLHWLGPIVVLAGSLFYEYVWAGTLDVLLILLYLGYGSLLLKSSLCVPEQVRLTDVPKVLVAERVAGAMLLFSALVDSALSYDILLLNAQHTNLILSISYLVLIPAVVSAVMVVSISTPAEANNKYAQTSPSMSQGSPEEVDTSTSSG
ncbi:AraC family transcriptional regulator, partial [Vibrio fortis]